MKPQGLGAHIATMQLMPLSEKMKFLTSKHPGQMSNKALDDVKFYTILLHIVTQNWESTSWISVSEEDELE